MADESTSRNDDNHATDTWASHSNSNFHESMSRTTTKIDNNLLLLSPKTSKELLEPQIMSPSSLNSPSSPSKPSSIGSRMTSQLDTSSAILISPAATRSSIVEPSPVVKTTRLSSGAGVDSPSLVATTSDTSPKPFNADQRSKSMMMSPTTTPSMLSRTITGGSPTLMEPSPIQQPRGGVDTNLRRPQSMVANIMISPTTIRASPEALEPSPLQTTGPSSFREGLLGTVEPPSVVSAAPAAASGGGKASMRISRRSTAMSGNSNVNVRPGAVQVDGPETSTMMTKTKSNPMVTSKSSSSKHMVGGHAVTPGAVSMPGVVDQDGNPANGSSHIPSRMGGRHSMPNVGSSLPVKQRISVQSCVPGAVAMSGVVDQHGTPVMKGGSRISRRAQSVSVLVGANNVVKGQSSTPGAVFVPGMGDDDTADADDCAPDVQQLSVAKGGRISRRSMGVRNPSTTVGRHSQSFQPSTEDENETLGTEQSQNDALMPGIAEDQESAASIPSTGIGSDISLIKSNRGGRRQQARSASESVMKGTSPSIPAGTNFRKSTGLTGMPGLSGIDSGSSTTSFTIPSRFSSRPSSRQMEDDSGAFRIDAANSAMNALGGVEESKVKSDDPNKNRQIWIAGGVAFGIVVLIAAIVGAVVATSGGKKEKVEGEPTSAPTANTGGLVLEELVDVLRPYSSTLNDPQTPQYQAAKWLSTEYELESLDVTDELLQRYVLAALYFGLGAFEDDEMAKLLDGEIPVCDWLGVLCSGDDMVVGLELENLSLSGSLISEVGHLTHLTSLKLATNQIHGTIPPEITKLTLLTDLFLQQNKFSGPLPAEIQMLSGLKQLILNDNRLSGSLPTEVANLENLSVLQLTYNTFSGNLPSEIGSMPSLQYLALGENGLIGKIPPEISHLSNLHSLYLTANQLDGRIPTELGDLSALTALDISRNALTGTIITELGRLTNLRWLATGTNFLEGTIPIAVGNLTSLNALDMSKDTLSGRLPSEIGLLTDLESLLLYTNFLTGEVPTELAGLTKLRILFLQENELIGDADPIVCNLSDLNTLSDARSDCLGDVGGVPEISCSCCNSCCNSFKCDSL